MALDQSSSEESKVGLSAARYYWLPICALLAGLCGTAGLWHITEREETSRIQHITKLVGVAVSADAAADSDSWLRELERFAKIGSSGHLTQAEWQENALLYIQHHPGTLSIDLHRGKQEEWIVSSPEHSPDTEADPGTQQHAIALATLSNRVVSLPFKDAGQKDGWITVVPIGGDSKARVFLIAAFDLVHSLDSMAEDVKGLGFSIAAGLPGTSHQLLVGATTDHEEQFRQTVEQSIADIRWQIAVWPKSEALGEMQSSTPATILVAGLLLSTMISLTVFFAQTSARRATFLEHANLRLQEENRERTRSQEALRASHAKFAGILQISPDAVISTDEQQRITLYNRGAENVFGYTAGEVLGQPMSILIPERLRSSHQLHVRRFDESRQQTLIMSEQSQLFGLRKDGTEIRLVGSVAKLEVDGEKIFTSMFRDVTESIRAAEQLRRAHDELELRVAERTADLESANLALKAEVAERLRAEHSLRELSGRLLRLQDEERRRIARELHDGTIQNLAALALTLNLVRDDLAPSAAAFETLTECLRLIQQSTGDLRTISYLLHPPVLEELGLTRTLHNYVDGFSRRSGITVTLEVSDQLGHLNNDVELTIFRIVQESLSNIHRHSNSPTAAIHLLKVGNTLNLQITDEGTGIPESSINVGVGIAGMRERVRLLGGEMDIKSSPAGTTIRVWLTIPEKSEPAGDRAPQNSAISAA